MKKLFTRVVRTALLAMCALMALPASAADLTPGTWYLDTSALVDNGKQWFNNDGAVLQLKNGNDIVSYTKLGDYLYSFTLSSNATSLTVNRNSSSGSLWNSWTVHHDTDASHNCIKLTSSSGGYEWETYSTPVTGNSIFYFVNDGNKSSLNVWAWYANNGDTNIFSGDWNGRPDILNFDTNKVASGQTFTITKGYIKSGSTYTDALKVETNANRLIFGNSGTLEDFNGKVYYTASSSFSTLSGTWTDTRLEQVKTPEITQSGNQVSISCETTDAVIYYTLNGDTPSDSSTKYDEAFTITENCTVKAIAIKEGMANSAIAEKQATLEQVKTPKIEQQGNKVFITCETEGATIYCSFNGNDPEIKDSYKYDPENGASFKASCTVKAIAVKEGMANSAVAEKAVTYTNCFTPGTYYIETVAGSGFWDSSAKLRINLGGNDIECTSIGDNYYSFEVPDNVSKITVKRYNSGVNSVWGSLEATPTNTNGENTIAVKSNGYQTSGAMSWEWRTYEPGTVPDELYLWYRKWEGENPEENARICVKLQKEGNKFTTTEPVHNYKYVIFSTSGTSFEAEDATNYGYATAEYTPPTLDNPVALTLGGEMFNATMGNLSFVVDFTSAARPTVLITPEMPHHLSIVGNIDGTENWESGKELKAVSKSFTLQDVRIDGDFAFINPITKIKYGARADRVLPFEENEVGVTADGNLRRRSEYKWQLAAGDKGDKYDITVDFTNSRNPSLLVKKHVESITAPAQLYIIGTHIGKLDDATTAMPMTKSGNTYYYDVENYAAGSEGEFRILSKRGTEANDWSMEQYEALTDGEVFPLNGYKVFNVRPEGNGKGFNWKFKDDSDGTYRIEINFTTRRVHITFSEGKANNKYFLVGDVNKWLNDGTYTYSIKDENGNYLDADGNIVANENQAATRIVSYGYDVNEHGERDVWELTEVAENERIPSFMNNGETWYKLKMPMYGDVKQALYGQFVIYQGPWNKAVWKDNKTIYHTVHWKEGEFKKWSNTVDTNAEEYLNTEAGIAPETVFNCGNKSGNLKLQHNYYHNATVYFTPTSDNAGKIYVAVEDPENDVKDIYVYYANSNAKDTDRPVIKANNSSINSNNYKLDVDLFNKEMEKVDGTLETKDGVTYSPYWRQKVRPGMECPSGQKITVTLSGATGVSSSNWATINIDDIYFLDGIHVFAQPNASEINVSKIESRIYGYSLDGSEIVVSKPDGTGAAPDEPTGNLNWTDMNRGNVLSSDLSGSHDLTGKWETDADNGKDWGSQHTNASLNHEISPSQATKYIQFRVTYTEIVQTPDGMRRVAGERTEVVPNYFALDKSDPSASWVLNGTHKVYTPGIETGVEDIFGDEFTEDGEEVETIYYNLQGQRVDNPDKGLYIRVRGTKTDKVLF